MNIEQNLTKLPVIVTGKPIISTSRRQVLPDIDLRQTGFRMVYLHCSIPVVPGTELRAIKWAELSSS